MTPRPRVRLPLWGALAIVGVAYLVRSLVLRGGDFALDMPSDAMALGAIGAGIALVAWARRRA